MQEVDFKDIKPGDIYMHSPTDAWSYKAIKRVPSGELAKDLIPPQKFDHDIIICQEVTKPTKFYYSLPNAMYYLLQSAQTQAEKDSFANEYPDICTICGKPAKTLLFSVVCSNKLCK